MLKRLRAFADAVPWIAPLVAAWWLPDTRGSVEIVGVLAVAPPLAATLMQKRGSIPALFATAFAWIVSSLAFLPDWLHCWTSSYPPHDAPTQMAAAWWAPFALSSIMLRGTERRTALGDAIALMSVGSFATFVLLMFAHTLAINEGAMSATRGMLLVVGALGFFAWLMKNGYRYTRDPLASLWWPALPISIAFTFVGLLSSTTSFHESVKHAIQAWPTIDRMLDPPLACYGRSCWSLWYDVVAVLVSISGTTTAAAAVAIAVARARGSSWPSLITILPVTTFLALISQRYFADFGGSLPVPVQGFVDLGTWTNHHPALFTAGVTFPIAMLAIRRARLGITPARSCVALAALLACAVAMSMTPDEFVRALVTGVSTTIAWIALEPPSALEHVMGTLARRWRERSE